MGIIKDFFSKRKENESKFKEWSENDKIQNEVENRKKSHVERELIKVAERDKEKAMKEALYWETKRQQEADKLNARNSMKYHPELFNNSSILKSRNDLLSWGKFQ